MIEDLKNIEKQIAAVLDNVLKQRFKLYKYPGAAVTSSLLFDAYTHLFEIGRAHV